MNLRYITILVSSCLLLDASPAFAQAGPALESALQVQTETTQAAIRSQEKIDQLINLGRGEAVKKENLSVVRSRFLNEHPAPVFKPLHPVT